MSLTVNTNVLALTAQNNLDNSQKSLNSAIERLSSGSKINSAKDNAAGQAIANRLTSQINGLQQASSNANDGISIAQTTEGALNQVNDNLQRIRELSVQAANGTNSSSDLQSIQDEIGQRLGEIDRVSQQTSFNGTKVLDGSKSAISIQVGAQDGQTIKINLQGVDSSTLKLDTFNVAGPSGTPTAVDGSAAIKINGVSFDTSGTAGDAVATTLTATDSGKTDSIGTPGANGLGTNQTLVQDSKGNFFVKDTTNALKPTYYAANVTATKGDGTATPPTTASISVSFNSDKGNGAATTNPLAALDNALKTVDNLRSGLGAVQNRFDSAISNIDSTSVNLSSAKSRITDTNYATEVSNLSKAKILQQAGQSVLAQANQTSQGVISLLQNA